MPVTTPTTTPITLYNTRTRTKEPFAPIDPKNVRMYVCGPTVYDRAHIGNARPVVVFDTLFRLLRHVYGEKHVTYVRNFTDVDDKINKRAAETLREGETELQAIRRITEETIGWYHADMDALGTLRPTKEPRATEFIGAMVAMIETLIARGHAYAAEGHVLFSVSSYPDYGTFAKRSLDEMRAGARVEVAPYKRDPMDFVLWKPSTPDQPGWESPWGRGRPGWHIECSAMSYELLGDSFDIHGGGIDLVFPHHENEIAQFCCAHPEGRFANVWMHNGFVNVEGEKMAKSAGNFFTVRDLLDKGVPGPAIRLVLLMTHYRQPMDFTDEKVEEAKAMLRKWCAVVETGGSPDQGVLHALQNDLNTWEAIVRLDELHSEGAFASLAASALLLGFDLHSIAEAEWAKRYEFSDDQDLLDDAQEILNEAARRYPSVGVVGWGPIPADVRRAALRVARQWMILRGEERWKEADELRQRSASANVELRAMRSADGHSVGSASLGSNIDLDALEALL
ncbi:cysteine--tRNA ligase [Amaricoccus sp. W119]|uniref:cysteine--tRNA ligase n=1 Tax=Amaricoccus sp. W119 TaxID=3391833 RepID=UPI0039A70A15